MILGAIGIGVVVLAVFFVLWSIGAYNNLVRKDALAQEGWAGVDVQLKRRYDLIPNLVAVVKQYSIHESQTLEKVIAARNMSVAAKDINSISQAETGLTGALKSLFAVVESYPDLKANQNFMALQKDLGEIENDIQLARRYYNGAVRNYNILVDVFPSNIIAKFSSFIKKDYFQLASDKEAQAPKVEF